jgi:hypothetical protein
MIPAETKGEALDDGVTEAIVTKTTITLTIKQASYPLAKPKS